MLHLIYTETQLDSLDEADQISIIQKDNQLWVTFIHLSIAHKLFQHLVH